MFDAYAQFEESMISAKMETTAEMGATEEGTLSFISSCSCYRRIILSCSYFAKKGCFFIQAWLDTQYCNASNSELILLRATIGAPNLISRLLLRIHRMYVVSIRLDFK